MKTNMPTRQQMFAAQKTMTDRGWNHVLSVLDSDSDEGRTDFGLLYARGDERFWMNHKTIGNLPT